MGEERAKPLIYRANVEVERVMGIEPTWPAWKAGALPLSYTRVATNGNRCPPLVNRRAAKLRSQQRTPENAEHATVFLRLLLRIVPTKSWASDAGTGTLL